MATISAPDLVLLRTAINKVTPYFSVLQPTTLLTALVNNASATRGMRTIAYDGGTGSGFSTIEAGQTLEVDTADGTFRTRVKSITGNQTSGSIVVDENPLVWLDNQVIRVIHSYDIQPIPPVIRSQIFYKFYDLVFSDQTVEPPPVAIIGSHLAGFLSAGSIVFQLNSSSSYAIADGASISSRVWSCVHMGGGTTGITISNTTTANPTLTLTIAGQYWLKCIVTDSNSKTQTTYRAIFIYDANNLPYKDFAVQSLSGDWSTGGWRATIVPFGDVTLDDFPDRQLCLLWYVGKFNSTEDYVNLWAINADNIILGGYIRQDNDTDQFSDGTGSVSFEVTTPDGVIDNISELGSISLNAVANPAFWYEYETWMTAGRAIHHLIKYHSYGILQCWDVLGLNEDTRGVLQAEFTEGALLQQINGLTFDRGIYAKMACDFFGRFHLVRDSNTLNDAGRAALDTVITILEADISGVVTLVRAPEESVSFAELNGFSFNGSVSTPFISILPGYRESSVSYIMPNLRGSGTMSIGNQILSSQTDSNERIGRVLAQQNNNPRELRFSTPYSGLGVFDIINSIGWYEWGIGDNDLKRDTELFQRLLICRSITHTFDHVAGTVQTELAFEPEAFGPDGIQGNYPTSYPTVIPPEPDWTPPVVGGDLFAVTWVDFNDSDHGKIRIGTLGSVSYGSTYAFETTGAVERIGLCSLNSTQILVAYEEGNEVFAKILTVSGNSITGEGTRVLLHSPLQVTSVVCDRLDDTHAIVIYAGGSVCYATALSVSGTTITLGTEEEVTATEGHYASVVALTSSKAFIAFGGDGVTGKGVVADISGVTITLNTSAAATAADNTFRVELVKLSSSSVLYFFDADNAPDPESIRCALITSITTTFTHSGEVEVLDIVNTADTTDMPNGWVSPIDGVGGIVAYTNSIKLVESDLTVGSAVPISMGGVAVAIATVNSTKAVQASGQIDGDGDCCTIGISGITLTDGGDQAEFADVSVAYAPRVCRLIV